MAAPKGNKNHLKHGMTHTRLYNIWQRMRQRCYDSNYDSWKYYGFKGITVCDDWKNSFEKFYDWAMANGYEDHLTIDRKENDRGYSPENCRWVTYKEQANNRTNNKILEFNGESHTITEWANITGMSLTTLWSRLDSGWSVEKALTTDVLGRQHEKR